MCVFFKDEYNIVALKYQFLGAKVQSIFTVPPIFGPEPLSLFGLVTALLVASGYLVPTVFIETRD